MRQLGDMEKLRSLSFSSMTVFSAIHDYDSSDASKRADAVKQKCRFMTKIFQLLSGFFGHLSHSKSATVFENHIKSLIASERATFYILRWWKMPKNSKIQKRHFG